MTKTMFASLRSASTSCHSRSLSGEPKLYAATRKSSLCARLSSRSAFRNGDKRLEPTYRTVIFIGQDLHDFQDKQDLRYTFQLVLKTAADVTQLFQHTLVNIPVSTSIRLQQPLHQRMRRVRIQIAQTLEHRLIKQKRVRDFRVDPIINCIRRRTPPESIRHVILDLRDTSEPVLQHPFIPFWIQRLRPCLEPHRLFERPNLHVTRKRVRQIDCRPRLRTLLDSLRHATEILKIVIYIRQPNLKRVDVLVSRLHPRQRTVHRDARFPALNSEYLRVATVSEALARHEKIPERLFAFPLRIHHHEIHVRTVVAGCI